nr:competence protein ComK [Mammaliicoccus sp. Marseille-Q6498]
MKNYIIKHDTMYLKGIKVNNHTVHTEVCEAGKDSFIVEQKPQEIMNQSCRFYGEHFQERKLFTKRLTNVTSKPPILVSPIISTYFFSTHSERTSDNTWINIFYVKDFVALKGNKTKIILEPDKFLVFPISEHVIKHQYLNCTFLHYRNYRNNLFIKDLNTSSSDLTKNNYNVLEAIRMYLKDHS